MSDYSAIIERLRNPLRIGECVATHNGGAIAVSRLDEAKALADMRDAAIVIETLRDKLDRIQALVGKASIDAPMAQIRQTLRDNLALASKPHFLKDATDAS